MAYPQMTLQDILIDIHALNQDTEIYEQKYGMPSETFYESYINGKEPDDDSQVLDWADWAGVYQILLRRRKQYHNALQIGKEPFDYTAWHQKLDEKDSLEEISRKAMALRASTIN